MCWTLLGHVFGVSTLRFPVGSHMICAPGLSSLHRGVGDLQVVARRVLVGLSHSCLQVLVLGFSVLPKTLQPQTLL